MNTALFFSISDRIPHEVICIGELIRFRGYLLRKLMGRGTRIVNNLLKV